MSRLEPNAAIKAYKNSNNKDTALKTKIAVAVIFLVLIGLMTLSYINGTIFIEYIAVCAFIISCLALIKLLENK